MIGAVIFDLDGTLLNTLASLANSFNRALETLGYPRHEVDAYRYFIGDGLVKCAERCLPEGVSDAALKEMVRVQQQDYGSSWDKDVTIYDGIIECLAHLQAEHTAIAVLSNKNHDFTLQCVERFFGDFRFDAVVGFSAEVPHKPDPTGAIAIARELGLHPAEIAFVGDTATDMHTAVAAGNLPVGALWGFREADELKKAGARHIIEHPTDLFAVMEGETK